jgi:hypothetical protein
MQDWDTTKSDIQYIFNIVKPSIESSGANEIQHYIDHDEFEIAFEILIMEMMELNDIPILDYDKLLKLGYELNLDKESVYDPKFWETFKKHFKLG